MATIIAENIPVAKARTIRMCLAKSIGAVYAESEGLPKSCGRNAQTRPPIRPQLNATTRAIRTSRIKTWFNFCAARWPVASPHTTIAEVCSPALPLMAAIIGTKAIAAA
ncbi:hypothetical protein ES703_85932 [subsurface metagenome]